MPREIGLITADKKDSQGLCFVGKISLPQFLQQKLAVSIGEVIEIPYNTDLFDDYKNLSIEKENLEKLSLPFTYKRDMGFKVAEHQGAHFYTIGQRKGLHIGGRPEPSFVLAIDTSSNLVFSGQTEHHPGLNRIALMVCLNDIHWINPNYKIEIGESLDCLIRIRYRQKLQKGTIYLKESGLFILFNENQRGITPGQFAAWYINEELVGSGVIHS